MADLKKWSLRMTDPQTADRITHEVGEILAQTVAKFALQVTHEYRPKIDQMRDALLAARSDPMGCHSIAVLDQIDAALAPLPPGD